MKVCTQCKGNGKVKTGGQPMNPPNSGTFTDVTTGSEYPCPSCLGTGQLNGFGAS